MCFVKERITFSVKKTANIADLFSQNKIVYPAINESKSFDMSIDMTI